MPFNANFDADADFFYHVGYISMDGVWEWKHGTKS